MLLPWILFAISFIIRAKPSINRINELLIVKPAIKNAEHPVDFNKDNYDIIFKNVNFATKIEVLRLYNKKGKEKTTWFPITLKNTEGVAAL